ncbi:major facilitator superfamily transporter [Diaporthe helianthi]|uniref:Major facilitator superfamily transporter n=1 Tax=Diaporthe helianthi TaxID=158607 RepID=A0A2P5HE39_DIAHE|nr:major facilitator superfamily transporter [Diaporthe helianthi]
MKKILEELYHHQDLSTHDGPAFEIDMNGDDESRGPTLENEIQFREGGWTAWCQVIAGNLLNMLAWGLPASFGVYQLYYTEEKGFSSSQASWVGSVK